MKRASLIGVLACAMIALAGLGPSSAQAALYSQNFDANDSANWITNNNGAGTNLADFFFDYSAVGIPSAPNSSGGSTRGVKLSANILAATAPVAGANPGISVSPLGQSFTGDYEVKFDWWSNYLGPLGASPTHSTQLSTFGILTSGAVANYDGSADGLFFAATGNGGVPVNPDDGDYGAFAPERPGGYQWPIDNPLLDNAFYVAGSRDNTATYYTTFFPGANAAPALQQANFPGIQTGATPAGTMGFRWHEVEIEKLGSQVAWRVDGHLLVYIDTAEFTLPAGGTNIMFGHSDINRTTSTSGNFVTLQFTLIDNLRVLSLAGDYNENGSIDEGDYATWREHYGDVGPSKADGNGDNVVDAADYTVWRNLFDAGEPGGDLIGGGGSSRAVPEPAAIGLCGSGLLVALAAVCRRSS